MNLRWLQVWDPSDVKDAAATGGFWSVDESVKQSSTGNVTCVPKSKGVFDGNLFPDLIAEERHERHQRSKRSPRRPCGACRLYAAAPHSLTTNKSRWFDGLAWEDKECRGCVHNQKPNETPQLTGDTAVSSVARVLRRISPVSWNMNVNRNGQFPCEKMRSMGRIRWPIR